MGRSAAERKRDHRARQACGQVVLPIRIDEVETAQMLIAGGLLAERDADDRQKIIAALQRQISILIELSRHA